MKVITIINGDKMVIVVNELWSGSEIFFLRW